MNSNEIFSLISEGFSVSSLTEIEATAEIATTQNMYFGRWKREWRIFEKFINFESIRKFVFVRLAQVQATESQATKRLWMSEWDSCVQRKIRQRAEKNAMFNIHWTICVYILVLDVMPYQNEEKKSFKRLDTILSISSIWSFVGALSMLSLPTWTLPTHNLHSHLCVIQSPVRMLKKCFLNEMRAEKNDDTNDYCSSKVVATTTINWNIMFTA